jgi:hydrogenase expression/formation protein HypE
MVVVVAAEDEARALALVRTHPLGANAAAVGTVVADDPPRVLVRTRLGVLRILDEPSGAPLPRIC